MTTEAPLTVRAVLRLLLNADSYPRLGNQDWREADLLEGEALHQARTAEPRAPLGAAIPSSAASASATGLRSSASAELRNALRR